MSEISGEVKQEGIADPVECLAKRCWKCKYWEGDKKKVEQNYKNNPISMDLIRGWPEYGKCDKASEWADIEISGGDALVELTVSANFGCPFHSA
jgi:hypothetical protein